MEVSVFRNFWDKQPVASTLEAMVEAIRSDARTKELTIGYRQQKRDLLKNESMLFAVPCIFEGGKSNGDVVRLTGVGMVDFDHIKTHPLTPPVREGGSDAERRMREGSAEGEVKSERVKSEKLLGLRQRVESDPHTLLCYTTISGEGLRVLYRYELNEGFELKQQM